jgi:hypothetical protein
VVEACSPAGNIKTRKACRGDRTTVYSQGYYDCKRQEELLSTEQRGQTITDADLRHDVINWGYKRDPLELQLSRALSNAKENLNYIV